jgi:hypothetical protein
MNGAKIMNLLSTDHSAKSIFTGFLTPDTYLSINNFPALVIINTDEISGPSEHWCVAFFKNKKICEYFDPFGFSPNNEKSGYNLIPNLFKNCSQRIEFNKKQVQALDAKTCGHHCVYFSLLRANNISMQSILNNFYTDEPRKNDSIVFEFIKNVQT